jgi:hypothetical protein
MRVCSLLCRCALHLFLYSIIFSLNFAGKPQNNSRTDPKGLKHLTIYAISIHLFPFFWRYILVSFLRNIPALLNFHFEHWLGLLEILVTGEKGTLNFWTPSTMCMLWSTAQLQPCVCEDLTPYCNKMDHRRRFCWHPSSFGEVTLAPAIFCMFHHPVQMNLWVACAVDLIWEIEPVRWAGIAQSV